MSNWLINNEAPYSQVMGSDQWSGKQSQVPLNPASLNHITSIPTSVNNVSTSMGNTTMPTTTGNFTISPLATSAPIKMSPNPFMTTITSSAGVYTPAPLGQQNPANVRTTPTSARVEAKMYTPGITNSATPIPAANSTTIKPVSENFGQRAEGLQQLTQQVASLPNEFEDNTPTPTHIKSAYTINTPTPIKAAYTINTPTTKKHQVPHKTPIPTTVSTTNPTAYVTPSPTLSSTPY